MNWALFLLHRKRAFIFGEKFSPWFQLYGEALLIHFISMPHLLNWKKLEAGCREPDFLLLRKLLPLGFL